MTDHADRSRNYAALEEATGMTFEDISASAHRHAKEAATATAAVAAAAPTLTAAAGTRVKLLSGVLLGTAFVGPHPAVSSVIGLLFSKQLPCQLSSHTSLLFHSVCFNQVWSNQSYTL